MFKRKKPRLSVAFILVNVCVVLILVSLAVKPLRLNRMVSYEPYPTDQYNVDLKASVSEKLGPQNERGWMYQTNVSHVGFPSGSYYIDVRLKWNYKSKRYLTCDYHASHFANDIRNKAHLDAWMKENIKRIVRFLPSDAE